MEIINFIWENALILIPVLYVIGAILKDTEKIPDKYIPLILLPFGIVLACLVLGGFTANAVVQGILVTGATVYTKQLTVQARK